MGPHMEWIRSLADWCAANAGLLWLIFAVSLALMLLTPLMVAWLIIKLPADYFVAERHGPIQSLERLPILRVLIAIAKNLLGIVLLVAGIVMLFTPGQGLLTIVVALILIDFPGKYRLERWIITRPQVWRSVHWLRTRAGRPSLQRPDYSASPFTCSRPE